MTVEDLEREFANRAVCHGGVDTFSADDAILLVDRAAAEGIPILGVDGISIVDGKTESLIENTADFSSGVSDGRGCWDDAKRFIESQRARVGLFEVVLGNSRVAV